MLPGSLTRYFPISFKSIIFYPSLLPANLLAMDYGFNGHEFEKTLGDSKGQRSLACCSSWGHKESDTTKMSTGNLRGFPGDSGGKESACNAGDPGLIPGLGRFPGERNGYPIQYSCLENSMDRGAWWAAVHGVARIRQD